MATDSVTARAERAISKRVADVARTEGTAFIPAAATLRATPWLGALVGVVSLVTVAPVRAPTSPVAIVSQALSVAWLSVLGVALSRDGSQPEQGVPT